MTTMRRRHLGRFLGALLRPPGGLLRASWEPLGGLLVPVWASWAVLGGLLARLMPSEAVFEASVGRVGGLLERFRAVLGPSWKRLGRSWRPLGPVGGTFSYYGEAVTLSTLSALPVPMLRQVYKMAFSRGRSSKNGPMTMLTSSCYGLFSSRSLLGSSWGHLGPSYGHLGRSWGHLGDILRYLGLIIGSSWANLGPSWPHRGRPGRPVTCKNNNFP